jgi:hypothetical protein
MNEQTIKLALTQSITFMQDDGAVAILKLCENGDIFVKGKLVENDKEVVDALREFLKGQGLLNNGGDISDEEIENAANKLSFFSVPKVQFEYGAKWYRETLKKK